MKHLTKRLDWLTTLVPFLCILFLCILFIAFPEDSSSVLGSIRFFLGDQFGSFYLLMGLGALFCSLYAAFSRFGSIRLGGKSPRYSNLQWGSMMFTAGLAADILFLRYSAFPRRQRKNRLRGRKKVPHRKKPAVLFWESG